MAEGREYGFVQFYRTGRTLVSNTEKSRACRTLNDASSPKVNGTYLIFIFLLFFPPFLIFSTTWFKNKKDKNIFLLAGIFLVLFYFSQKYQKYFLSLKILWKSSWISFRANFWTCTRFSKHMTVTKESGQRGPADPTGRPTQGQRLLGPTISNGYRTVVPGSSSGALVQNP